MTIGALVAVAGCGSGISPSRPFDAQFFIGTESGDASANGLPFADGGQTLEDVEGNTLTVRLVRFESDPGTGETLLIPSSETVTIPATFTGSQDAYDGSRDVSITLNGETITFIDGVAQLPTGQTVNSYLRYRLAHSGIGAIYAYARPSEPDGPGAEDPAPIPAGYVDTEGFYAIGFETNPDVIAARVDQVRYTGNYYGFAQVYDAESTLAASGVDTRGSITLEAEFGAGRISGLLGGQLGMDDDAKAYQLVFLGAPLIGNGFVGVADMECAAGNACSSDTSVAGAFFGPNGEEVSGVIAFDETVSGPDGYRFIGTGGFAAD